MVGSGEREHPHQLLARFPSPCLISTHSLILRGRGATLQSVYRVRSEQPLGLDSRASSACFLPSKLRTVTPTS